MPFLVHLEHPAFDECPPALFADVRLPCVNTQMISEGRPTRESFLTADVGACERPFAGVPPPVYRQLLNFLVRLPAYLANVGLLASVSEHVRWKMTPRNTPPAFGAEYPTAGRTDGNGAGTGVAGLPLDVVRVGLGVQAHRGENINSLQIGRASCRERV